MNNVKKEKIRKESDEQTSVVSEEELINTETTAPISKQTNHSDVILRSCLLRTESLPTGIITTTRYSREDDDTTKIPNNFNEQFILCSKQAPYPTLINNIRERLQSFSSQISQTTDDEDDKTGSLHVLSDEQLDHLAYEYHPYPSDPDPIDELILHLQYSKLQAKTFFRKLFKVNSTNK